jgi:hypothetical protein
MAPALDVVFRQLRRHGLAVGVCFAHAVTEKGAPSSWSASAHLATGRRFHTQAFVPELQMACPPPPLEPARALSWSPPRRLFTANAGPKPESLTSTHVRTQAHARAHKFARRLTRQGTRPPAAYRRRTEAAVPAPAST